MAGSGDDKELENWQVLTRAVQDAGADAIELNFSCPHMDRVDMGSNVGKDKVLCSVSTQAVKEVARIPVWVKLTPATANIVEEAEATFLGGADAISSSNTFPSIPLIDPETLEFEVNVDGYASSGGLGGPAILAAVAGQDGADDPGVPGPRVLRAGRDLRVRAGAQLLPPGLRHVQVATAAMLDHAIGPNVIKDLTSRDGRVPRPATRIAAGRPSRTSAACAATGSSRTRRSRGPILPTTTAGTRRRPRATRLPWRPAAQ